MKRIIRILVLSTLINIVSMCHAFADTINIPADYSTIQAGIDAASNGDTVLVASGTYYENIVWPETNSIKLIGNSKDDCIIDGNQDGQVIHIENWEIFYDSTTVIKNFTIQNGYWVRGSGIYIRFANQILLENLIVKNNYQFDYNPGVLGNIRYHIEGGAGIHLDYNSSPIMRNIRITNNYAELDGGGLFLYSNSEPTLENVTIANNISENNGGGISCKWSNPSLVDVTVTNNSAVDNGGGIYCQYNSKPTFSFENRCNIYYNTVTGNKGAGAEIFTLDCPVIDVIVDTFTVMNPSDYYASPIDSFNFDILNSVEDSLIDADMYVSVDGDDSNSGTSPDKPFKTIKHALKMIYSYSLNINTIYLAKGIYSPYTNGESFPIKWNNYVNLSGSGEDETVLDADSTGCVIEFISVIEAFIEGITISGGYSDRWYGGGGIYCLSSSPILENVTITYNYTAGDGGGISCRHSSPILENVTISTNYAAYNGGGIYCYDSNLSLVNCILWNDTPNEINGSVTATYSDIQGGWTGTGNIDADPLFVDPLNGDYHLSWANFPIPDSTKSPCIDAGDPNSPLDPDGTIAEMGAYYFNQNVSVDDPQEITTCQLINYPNPIGSNINDLTVSFYIHKPGKVKIQLFNIKGQLVSTLINEDKNIGNYTISHSVNELSSGIYFTSMSVGVVVREIKKVVLLR